MKNKKLFWIFSLAGLCYFIQGWEGLPGLSLFKYFKEELHYPAEKLMVINAVIGLSWLPKILWGWLIDQFKSRRFWITISIAIDLITVLILGIWSLPVIALITFMFINSTDSAIRDVAVDGTVCVEGKKHKLTGKLQCMSWIFITIASIIVGLTGGFIAEHFSYKVAFFGLIPLYFLMLIPTYRYKETVVRKKRNNFKETLTPYKQLLKQTRFLWGCLFLFLYCFSPSFGTPLSYIQRDKFLWSFQFLGILSAICSVCSILGAIVYWKLSKKINVQKWLFYSVFLGAVTTLAYLHFTPVSAIVYGIIFSMVGFFIHLTVLDWMAQNTIDGLEATTFALLCGIHNLSGSCSSFTGAWLYPKVGLKPLIIIASITSFSCLIVIKKIFNKEGGKDVKNTNQN